MLVLEHQTHMQNFITRLYYESTIALRQYGHVRYLNGATEGFLKYLLFTEEAPWKAPIQGSAEFTRAFANDAPRDKQGRSLREFDLNTRLFKYPCSYLIYSDAFETLPREMKTKIYARLWDILSGKDSSPDYAKLSTESRRAIAEILADTKSDLPQDWVQASSAR